jgi:hypothetical protein
MPKQEHEQEHDVLRMPHSTDHAMQVSAKPDADKLKRVSTKVTAERVQQTQATHHTIGDPCGTNQLKCIELCGTCESASINREYCLTQWDGKISGMVEVKFEAKTTTPCQGEGSVCENIYSYHKYHDKVKQHGTGSCAASGGIACSFLHAWCIEREREREKEEKKREKRQRDREIEREKRERER